MGRSPCRLTITSCRPARIEAADRLEDVIGAGKGDRAGRARLCRRRPRWRSRSPTRPPPPAPVRSPASTARRQTWTIIGSPWISARGLPGRRVEAMREGMTMSGFTVVRRLFCPQGMPCEIQRDILPRRGRDRLERGGRILLGRQRLSPCGAQENPEIRRFPALDSPGGSRYIPPPRQGPAPGIRTGFSLWIRWK